MNSENNSGVIKVQSLETDVRLDAYLCSHFETLSRSKIQTLIKQSHIKVNNKKAKPSHLVSNDDHISFDFPIQGDTLKVELSQKNIEVEIVFEDEHILVVNKPPGLITHPGIGNTEESLVHAVYEKLLKNDPVRPGVVHRLDKETSGLLVLAKNQISFDKLKEQFKNKTAKRVYWALHFGKLKAENGSWDSLLNRSPKNRVKFSSQESGKRAITHYKTVTSGPMSITELSLDTGRTHQIRVHMSESHLPILNDSLYGSDKNLNSILDVSLRMKLKSIKRMALVARKLSFTHPHTDEVMEFEVPWPEELDIL